MIKGVRERERERESCQIKGLNFSVRLKKLTLAMVIIVGCRGANTRRGHPDTYPVS
jgi:hypothetical protein